MLLNVEQALRIYKLLTLVSKPNSRALIEKRLNTKLEEMTLEEYSEYCREIVKIDEEIKQ